MKLFLLVTLTMCAFAANSVLNRIGVGLQGMEPMDFATVRTAAGAAMLWGLVAMRPNARPPVLTGKRLWGALALAAYMIGFSRAYLTLDAGLGALILFGVFFGALSLLITAWVILRLWLERRRALKSRTAPPAQEVT